MESERTGLWIVSGLASNGHDVDLSYAALALTPDLKLQIRRLVAGWNAAAAACQERYFSLELSAGPAYWMRRLPDCVDHTFSDTLEMVAWAVLPISPIAEIAIGTDAAREEQGRSIDRVCTATECERICIQDRVIHFEAREKHGDGEVWTNALPEWVLNWALGEEGEEE